MGSLFNSGEIIKLAIQIEKNGRGFCDRAARAAKSPRSKKLFEFLKSEEEKHLAVFDGMLKRIDRNDPGENFRGEQAEYMMALAHGNIFPEEKEEKKAVRGVRGDVAAIKLGIEFEKDSILFYSEMKKYVSKEYQETVEEVIGQEKEHFRRLSRLLKEI